MKTCTRCGERQPDTSFHFKNKKLKKRRAWCSACACLYSKTHYEANIPYYTAHTDKMCKWT